MAGRARGPHKTPWSISKNSNEKQPPRRQRVTTDTGVATKTTEAVLMISTIHIAQRAHFRAAFRFIGHPKRKAVEIEHHPQNDPSRTWVLTRPRAHSVLALCELEVWTVFGERTVFCFACRRTEDLPKQAVTITADKSGLTVVGVESAP